MIDFFKALYDIKNGSFYSDREKELLKFGAACFSNYDKSTAQNYQDIWALYENNFKRDGFFVEFGATDGLTGNNTYLLEKEYNWTGILAEPNSVWHEKLISNRPNSIHDKRCVFVSSGGQVSFLRTDDAALSTIKGFGVDDEFAEARAKSNDVVPIETVSLYDLLMQHNAPEYIDYISVDTEGTEYGIVNAFLQKNDKYKVRTFTIEHNFGPMRERIQALMMSHGYQRKFPEISRWDDFFVKDFS
jgi:FkbM family methyltransferase